MLGQAAEAYPSITLPIPNDDKSLSFDYTQDRFGTGQAGQVLCGAGNIKA